MIKVLLINNSIRKEYYNFLFLIFVLFFVSCSSYRDNLVKESSSSKEAIIFNTIIDYANIYKKDLNKYSVFFIDDRSLDDKDYYQTSITPIRNKYKLEKIGNDYKFSFEIYPTNYIVYKNNLFLWYNDKSMIDEKLIETMMNYDIIHVEGDYEFVIDDNIESVNYVFCKKNLSKYAKIRSNKYIASNSDKLPILDCN